MSKGAAKQRTIVRELNLLETPVTWFNWKGSEHTVKETPAEMFDQWIRQYVDQVVNVDVSVWEIFHRWGIINACINGKFLELVDREGDGRLLKEPDKQEKEDSSELK